MNQCGVKFVPQENSINMSDTCELMELYTGLIEYINMNPI